MQISYVHYNCPTFGDVLNVIENRLSHADTRRLEQCTSLRALIL